MKKLVYSIAICLSIYSMVFAAPPPPTEASATLASERADAALAQSATTFSNTSNALFVQPSAHNFWQLWIFNNSSFSQEEQDSWEDQSSAADDNIAFAQIKIQIANNLATTATNHKSIGDAYFANGDWAEATASYNQCVVTCHEEDAECLSVMGYLAAVNEVILTMTGLLI